MRAPRCVLCAAAFSWFSRVFFSPSCLLACVWRQSTTHAKTLKQAVTSTYQVNKVLRVFYCARKRVTGFEWGLGSTCFCSLSDARARVSCCGFLCGEQVEELGVSNLVGTPLLRGYMHGYFMDMKLYTR